MEDAPGLVDLATSAHFIDAGSNYPGIRAPVPPPYVRALLSALGPLIEEALGQLPEDDLDLCAFSMVTSQAGDLRASQRIPHFDGPEPRRIAFLHYLCAPGQGGTSFYRHRASGLEIVQPADVEDYRCRLASELRTRPPPPEYVTGDTALFERVHCVPAAFNRLL